MQKFLYPLLSVFLFFFSFLFCLSLFFLLSSFLFLGDLFTVMPVPTERRLLSFQKNFKSHKTGFFILFFLCTVKKNRQSRNHNFPKILKLERLSNNKKSIQNRLLVRFLLMTQKREQQFGSVQAHPSFQTQTNKQTTKDNNFKTLTWLLFGSKQQHRHRQQSLNSSHSHLLFDRNGSVSCGCRRPRVGSRTKTFFSQQ